MPIVFTLNDFKDNAWADVKTEKTGANTYRAETKGFSNFAIVVVSNAVSPTATPELEVTSKVTATPEVTGTPSEYAPPVDFALIIGLIVIIVLISVIYIKRKDIFKK